MKHETQVSEVQCQVHSFFLLIVVTQIDIKPFGENATIIRSIVQEICHISLFRELSSGQIRHSGTALEDTQLPIQGNGLSGVNPVRFFLLISA
jgi:hypothetical protein